MASLNHRIRKLELKAPELNPLPEPPCVAGRPRQVAIAEYIEHQRRLLRHPLTPEADQPQIEACIAHLESLHPQPAAAAAIWYRICTKYPDDDYQINKSRYEAEWKS